MVSLLFLSIKQRSRPDAQLQASTRPGAAAAHPWPAPEHPVEAPADPFDPLLFKVEFVVVCTCCLFSVDPFDPGRTRAAPPRSRRSRGGRRLESSTADCEAPSRTAAASRATRTDLSGRRLHDGHRHRAPTLRALPAPQTGGKWPLPTEERLGGRLQTCVALLAGCIVLTRSFAHIFKTSLPGKRPCGTPVRRVTGKHYIMVRVWVSQEV